MVARWDFSKCALPPPWRTLEPPTNGHAVGHIGFHEVIPFGVREERLDDGQALLDGCEGGKSALLFPRLLPAPVLEGNHVGLLDVLEDSDVRDSHGLLNSEQGLAADWSVG